MRRVKQVLVIGAFALALGGVGTASASFVITSIHQISPHVRAQLKGNRGPRGFTGSRGSTGAQGPAGFVSQIRVVESEHLTLQPGESSYEADPNNFLATCPAGYSVIGTGFNGPFPPTGGFVLGYGNFVGGFFANESSIRLTDVYVDAI